MVRSVNHLDKALDCLGAAELALRCAEVPGRTQEWSEALLIIMAAQDHVRALRPPRVKFLPRHEPEMWAS